METVDVSNDQLRVVKVIDPRVDLEKSSNKTYAILDSGSENTAQTSISNSFSNNVVNISCDPPSDRVLINRHVVVEIEFEINFVGVAPLGSVLLQCLGMNADLGVDAGNSNRDAPRANGLRNATTSIQVKMNNDTLSANVNSYYKIFDRYYNDETNRRTFTSMTPTALDRSLEYNDAFGTINNVLAGKWDLSGDEGRGGYIGCRLTQNTNTNASVRLIVRECIPISPFLSQKLSEKSAFFIGVQTMSLIYNLGGMGVGPLAGLVGSLWSHDNASPSVINSASVNVLNSQSYFTYMTPDPTMIIPSANSYAYYEPVLYSTINQVPMPPNSTNQIRLNSVILGSVPNRMYLCVAESDALFDYSKTDTYCAIENINVTWDNKSALFSSFTVPQLYAMSVKNGLGASYREFTQDVGSVICIEFATDLALGSTYAPGTIGSFSLSLIVTYRNQRATTLQQTQLKCVVISEGVLTASHNHVSRSLGVLTRADVLRSKGDGASVVEYTPPDSFYGGGASKFSRFFTRTVPRLLRRGVDFAQNVLAPHLAPQYGQMIQRGSEILKSTTGEGRRRRVRRGAGMLSKDELLALM